MEWNLHNYPHGDLGAALRRWRQGIYVSRVPQRCPAYFPVFVGSRSLMKEILTPREAAEYLSIHVRTIYRLAKLGEIPGRKVGGSWRFKKDTLDAWLSEKEKPSDRKDLADDRVGQDFGFRKVVVPSP